MAPAHQAKPQSYTADLSRRLNHRRSRRNLLAGASDLAYPIRADFSAIVIRPIHDKR